MFALESRGGLQAASAGQVDEQDTVAVACRLTHEETQRVAATALIAHGHQGMVVTVSMDKIDFKAPVRVGDLVSFFTETLRVGRSSIKVKVAVWACRRFGGGEHEYVTEAEVTMVAVDESFKPTPVNGGKKGKIE